MQPIETEDNQKFLIQKFNVEESQSEDYLNSHQENISESYIKETVKVEVNWDVPEFECNICGVEFSDQFSLEHHVNECHQNDLNDEQPDQSIASGGKQVVADENDVRPFRCQLTGCIKSFKTKTNLNRHMLVHSEENPIECQYPGCSKTFKCQYNFKLHIKRHSDERPFNCIVMGCAKSFKTKRDLKAHMTLHSAERPLKCPQPGCTKSFKRKDEVNAHIPTHNNERPFKCDHSGCSKSFKRKFDLYQHRLTHNDQKPLRCLYSWCGKSFKTQRNLNKHIMRCHSNEKISEFSEIGCGKSSEDKVDLDSHMKVNGDETGMKHEKEESIVEGGISQEKDSEIDIEFKDVSLWFKHESALKEESEFQKQDEDCLQNIKSELE